MFRNTFYYLYFENDTTVLSDTGLGSRVFPELSVTDLGHKATYKGKTGAVAATVNATVAVRPYLLTQAKTRRLVVRTTRQINFPLKQSKHTFLFFAPTSV